MLGPHLDALIAALDLVLDPGNTLRLPLLRPGDALRSAVAGGSLLDALAFGTLLDSFGARGTLAFDPLAFGALLLNTLRLDALGAGGWALTLDPLLLDTLGALCWTRCC